MRKVLARLTAETDTIAYLRWARNQLRNDLRAEDREVSSLRTL